MFIWEIGFVHHHEYFTKYIKAETAKDAIRKSRVVHIGTVKAVTGNKELWQKLPNRYTFKPYVLSNQSAYVTRR